MLTERQNPLIIKALNYQVTDGDHRRILFNDLALTISQGECVALMGDSGSGKSTLLNLIAGLTPLQQGTIQVTSTAVNKATDQQLSELRKYYLSIIFQNYNLLPGLTVADNISFSARLAERFDATLCADLVEQLGMKHMLSKLPAQLSGGEQQRVAIARSIAAKPKLILADEPTGNLDQSNSDKVLSQLLHLVKHYRTSLLLVTHSHELASRLDRVLHLSNGRLIPLHL